MHIKDGNSDKPLYELQQCLVLRKSYLCNF